MSGKREEEEEEEEKRLGIISCGLWQLGEKTERALSP
jgi:hypothetical protein